MYKLKKKILEKVADARFLFKCIQSKTEKKREANWQKEVLFSKGKNIIIFSLST